MFNPVTKVCDWPGVVKYIRPMCDPNHKPPKKRKTELTRVDLIKPTLNELGKKFLNMIFFFKWYLTN